MALLSDLYLYLARLDKTDVRILLKLRSPSILPSRYDNLNALGVPEPYLSAIQQVIVDNRLLWEPWVETADSYNELKVSLKNRGYNNLPTSGKPEFIITDVATSSVNPNNLPQKKIMIRKRTS